MMIGSRICIRMVNGIHMMMTIGRMSVNQVPSGRIMRRECDLYSKIGVRDVASDSLFDLEQVFTSS